MQAKIYVLDTNVLLYDPTAIYKFEDNDVVIPIYVIEEIDRFKREMSDLGRNAREIARFLDQLREQSNGSLQSGVELQGGGRLTVAVPTGASPSRSDHGAMDRAIMRTAMEIRDAEAGRPVVLVTMDSNLRIRADAQGLRAENYEGGRVTADELYRGIVTADVDPGLVDLLASREPVAVGDIGLESLPHPQAGIVLRSIEDPKRTALGRYRARDEQVVPIRGSRDGAWGVRPRNLEQRFAFDVLMDPDVQLVTLSGKAGTGKTLLAIAAGLRSVVDEGTYGRLRVSRPVFPLGRDVGYLPGTIEEKLNPWMQPIFDNLEYIFATGRARGPASRDYTDLIRSGVVEVEPLTYIRGRSLPNQYLIVDEAQNLSPHEVKTVVTRCGSGTKIVLTGDPYQIDNPYVDSSSNGLTVVAQRFRDEDLAAHFTLIKGERSDLAERATRIL